ncbi:UDP-glucose 6-dehydrogenase 1 [Hibiscus syriacus]|uniref:UDP-glucose 6-dehydrogenase n=1 Tax=Hibiscus syriacus TaxID=106335 RepID=A0A6A3CWN3_HIBSY|nr:UDP-glucose 6-dehydrogenase 1 [Hibiscus syriacus]
MIADVAKSNKIVVEKSTVPVKTAEAIEKILTHNSKGINFQILSNPEFLAEGTAISDLFNPDRVLIGGRETPEGKKAIETLRDVYAHWVPVDRIICTNLWSAELSKLAANAFLAQRISSVNSMSALCEATGADVSQVSHAVGKDMRIGPKKPGSLTGLFPRCSTPSPERRLPSLDLPSRKTPATLERHRQSIPTSITDVSVVSDAYTATKDAHGLCILTEWDEFQKLDFQKIFDNMQKPAFVFDGRHVVDVEKLRKIGFIVYSIGKPLDDWLKDMPAVV